MKLSEEQKTELEAGTVEQVEAFIHEHGAQVQELIDGKRELMADAHEILDRKNQERLALHRANKPAGHPPDQVIG